MQKKLDKIQKYTAHKFVIICKEACTERIDRIQEYIVSKFANIVGDSFPMISKQKVVKDIKYFDDQILNFYLVLVQDG